MTTGDELAKPEDENSVASPSDVTSQTDAAPQSTTDSSAHDPPEKEPSASDATPESQAGHVETTETVSPSAKTGSGPLSKLARGRGPLAARGNPLTESRDNAPVAAKGLGITKPSSPTVDPGSLSKSAPAKSDRPKTAKNKKSPRKSPDGERGGDASAGSKPKPPKVETPTRSKIAVPNIRHSLPDDIQAELDAAFGSEDVDAMLEDSAQSSVRKEPLAEGARVHAQVLKIHEDSVFLTLGGPDEGIVPLEQFTKEEPTPGDSVEVIIRGKNRDDGLFALSLPGGAIEVTDWEDIEEGTVVEATITGSNTGGLECKVGGTKGFIPISQISDVRVEDTSDYVNQKLLCVVTEANQRRGNLVLSHRAILEREREEKRKEQLEKIQDGDLLEGSVRSIKDFGAFVDLGGLDGLIHISKLSWERVKHPGEVLEVGQKVKVKVDKIDKDTGKISLSYRDLLDNPWDSAEEAFSVGSIHRGQVTRVANFGCFVKLTAGVEGLVHVSELAHHRVSKVDAFIQQGAEVEVKVLSFDRDSQKIGLSIKAAQQSAAEADAKTDVQEEAPEPPREVAVKATHSGPLKGGNNRETGGEKFGLRW